MFNTSRPFAIRLASFVAFVLASFALLTGCGDAASGSSEGGEVRYPYKVVATVGMVGDIAENVAGELAIVTTLMGEGIDPHLYKATRDDVAAMSGADVVFYNGLMLEGKMSDVLVRMSSNRPVVAVTENIEESYLLEPEAFAGQYDPHVWMDPAAWAKAVDVVADTLAEYDPANADGYRSNAEAYKQQLADLKSYGESALDGVPEGRRVLVTSHDAFNYFGQAFGLEVMGVQGISTESEAGLQRVNELVDLLVERNVQAVFVESSVPRKSIEALINGARSRGHEVTIGGELFSDAMGSAGTYEGTYVGMIDHNVTTVARALGGDVPDKGMNGKLTQ
ncbi:MAG: zinc ABC transporter substrate-binding protein [Planctomycetota bacterium]